jgi:hypothetical protein
MDDQLLDNNIKCIEVEISLNGVLFIRNSESGVVTGRIPNLGGHIGVHFIRNFKSEMTVSRILNMGWSHFENATKKKSRIFRMQLS